jgi:hypothetical protein
MRHALVPTALLAALLLGAPAQGKDQLLVREENPSFALEGAEAVDIDVPVGDVKVSAGAGQQVEAHLWLRCDEGSRYCKDRAAAIHLVPTHVGDRLSLKVDGYDHNGHHGIHHPDVELEVKLPASLGLRVDMGVGDLDVRGVEGDVNLDLGVGDAKVEIPESAVRSAAVDAGVGEARLYPHSGESEHHGFLHLGNEASWHDGQGRSSVKVHVGVGDASVHLTP